MLSMLLALAFALGGPLLVGITIGEAELRRRESKKRAAAGYPSFWEIIKHHRFDLKLVSAGDIPLQKVRDAMARGGRSEVARTIHEHFKPSRLKAAWSVGYCFPHLDYNGKRRAGYWSERDRNMVTVFFYDPATPPPTPTPAPVLVTEGWTATDEQRRLEMFLEGPSAFWLNPDWSDPKQPFWERDPAPIPVNSPQTHPTKLYNRHTFDKILTDLNEVICYSTTETYNEEQTHLYSETTEIKYEERQRKFVY
jgi:hypothetical protein